MIIKTNWHEIKEKGTPSQQVAVKFGVRAKINTATFERYSTLKTLLFVRFYCFLTQGHLL